jgi:hypothetical protein
MGRDGTHNTDTLNIQTGEVVEKKKEKKINMFVYYYLLFITIFRI